jgi:hypothetical protein
MVELRWNSHVFSESGVNERSDRKRLDYEETLPTVSAINRFVSERPFVLLAHEVAESEATDNTLRCDVHVLIARCL